MSLLNEIVKNLKENATGGATGAGAIAAVHGRLGGDTNSQSGFTTAEKRRKKPRVQQTQKNNALKRIERLRLDDKTKNIIGQKTTEPMIRRSLGEAWQNRLAEMIQDDETFDAADVNSKLDASEKRSRNEQDSVPFGMEDEDGNIVKVYVRSEQADEFEVALADALAGDSSSEDDDVDTSKEIAEVLFALKDKFDIVDVAWPQIEGDEEEETEMAAEEAGMETEGGAEGELGEEGVEGGEEDPFADIEGDDGGEDLDDLGGDMEMEPEGGAESTLQSVIDMMKADAEARKADAEARSKEAEARSSEANAKAAGHKVEQEEQILDMEAHEKRKKSEQGEAERLAKLAKYQHELAAKENTKAEEEEEDTPLHQEGMVSKEELGSIIQRYLQSAQ